MKNLFTLLVCLALSIYFSSVKAQNIYCDSLSLNDASINTIQQELIILLENFSDTLIVYPEFMATIDSNIYLMTDPAITNETFLDRVDGTNNGLTDFDTPLLLYTDAASVPLNTTFTGTATFYHPDDNNFQCSWSFSFEYGSRGGNSVKETNAKSTLQIFPNPATEIIYISNNKVHGEFYSIVDGTGRVVADGKMNDKLVAVDLSSFDSGFYFILSENQISKFVIAR